MPWCLTTSRRAADADVLLLQLSQPAELEVGVGSLVDFANLQPQIGIRKTHQAFRLHLERGVIQGHANGVVHSHSDISRPLSGICSGREQRPRCDNQTDDATAPQRCSDWLIPRCGVKSYFFCPGRGINNSRENCVSSFNAATLPAHKSRSFLIRSPDFSPQFHLHPFLGHCSIRHHAFHNTPQRAQATEHHVR
jgi:hypothetical protein